MPVARVYRCKQVLKTGFDLPLWNTDEKCQGEVTISLQPPSRPAEHRVAITRVSGYGKLHRSVVYARPSTQYCSAHVVEGQVRCCTLQMSHVGVVGAGPCQPWTPSRRFARWVGNNDGLNSNLRW
jgi:hypothetical protein